MILKKHRVEIIALCLIITVNIYAQTPLREVWTTKAYWISDDVDNMNVANNLRLGKGLSISYQQYQDQYVYPLPNNINATQIFHDYPELYQPYAGKGPPYYLLLGVTYWITNATETNWNFWGSVLNGIITIFLIVSLFFFSKKYFGLDVAIISAFVVSIATLIVIYSVRPLHYPLLYLFIIMSLFFIKKTKRDYILFGIFAGLADLTHPIGILPIVSYGLFLLVKKEFKGSGIVFLSYFLVLLPWLIRNILTFGGFGYGLGIPYSDKISQLLGLQIFAHTTLHPGILGQALVISKGIFPLDTFIGFYQLYLTEFWHAHIITLVLFFIIFNFTSFEGIKKSLIVIYHESIRKRIFFGAKILVVLSLTIFLVTSSIWVKYVTNNPDMLILVTQMILIFLFPSILLIILYKNKKEIFEINIPRINLVIMFFTLVSLLIYLGYSHQSDTPIPELKIIMPIFLVGLPLGICGIKKITKYVSEQLSIHSAKTIAQISNRFSYGTKIKIKNKYRIENYMFLSIMVLLCGYALSELHDGTLYWESLGVHKFEPSQQDLYNWLNQNIIDKNTVVASDMSQVIWSQTGLRSTSIPTGELESYNIDNLESYIQKYNVTYIVMHYTYDTWILDTNLGSKYYFHKVYQSANNIHWYSLETRNYQIYKVDNVFDNNIDAPYTSVEKAIILKEHGNEKEANKIYSNLTNSGLISKTGLLTQFRLYTTYDNLNETANILNQVHPSQLQDLKNLVSSYNNEHQTKKLDNMMESVNNVIDKYPDNLGAIDLQLVICVNEGLTKSLPSYSQFVSLLNRDVKDDQLPIWGDIVNTLVNMDDNKYKKIAVDLFENATKLEEQGNYLQALKSYQKTQYVDGYTTDSLKGQIKILTQLKDYDSALRIYDKSIDGLEQMYQNPHNAPERNDIQNTLINTMYAKADLLTNIQRYDDANDVYLDIIRLNQFDEPAHEKRAMILEKLGDVDEAAKESDFAKRLTLMNK